MQARQCTITSFFGGTNQASRYARVAGGELIKCPYCPKTLQTPQGYAQHVRYHKDKNHTLKRPFGKVKLLPDLDAQTKKQRSNSPEQAEVEPAAVIEDEIKAQKKLNDEVGMQSRFTLSQKIKILDKYHELNDNKNATVKWVREEFKRPKYSKSSLRKAIKREDKIRSQRGKKRTEKMSGSRLGEFPLMEKELACWIRDIRAYGVPVETFMLKVVESRALLGVARDSNVWCLSSTQPTKTHPFGLLLYS